MYSDNQNPYRQACRKDIPYPSISNESVPSLIDNLVSALYGTITKSVVNGRVQWNIPCDPSSKPSTIMGYPRMAGEGLLCYIIRVFSNLTLTGNFSGTFTGNLGGGTNGAIPYALTSTTSSWLPIGTTGQFLKVSATGVPIWTDPGVINVAANISGGLAGQVPWQSAPNTTGFISAGSLNQLLHSNGTSVPTWSSVVPDDLSTGHPTWDTSGNLNISGNITGNAATTINLNSIVNALIFG